MKIKGLKELSINEMKSINAGYIGVFRFFGAYVVSQIIEGMQRDCSEVCH